MRSFFAFYCQLLLGLSPNPLPNSHPPSLPPSLKKMSVNLTTDIQLEGENGPLIEPCSRGKTSPQPQGTKEGTGDSVEPEDSSPQDAQVGENAANNHTLITYFVSVKLDI